jgi:hypothetical protein
VRVTREELPKMKQAVHDALAKVRMAVWAVPSLCASPERRLARTPLLLRPACKQCCSGHTTPGDARHRHNHRSHPAGQLIPLAPFPPVKVEQQLAQMPPQLAGDANQELHMLCMQLTRRLCDAVEGRDSRFWQALNRVNEGFAKDILDSRPFFRFSESRCASTARRCGASSGMHDACTTVITTSCRHTLAQRWKRR